MAPEPPLAKPFGRVLVANRGEIARRIFRTARRIGMETVAVFSDADVDAAFVREADHAAPIGPTPARASYLAGQTIIEAALASGADAVHPGYGFLSENADFAEAVTAAGLVWIGPPAEAIRAMGLKDAAKALMEARGVPVTPGYHGDDQSPKRLKAAAKSIGYPVLIKAVAGGGGRGMRRVDGAEGFDEALASARREAAAAFGDERVLVEKYVTNPRHIEVQVFADDHGDVIHLYERDCSLQRRRQKLVEEAPAPGMTPEVREAMTAAAIEAARAVGYRNAGTVEFIVDGSGPLRVDGFWFMEMNTRLQVEHPVTEMVTGLDLVELQFAVAAGARLPAQQEIRLSGHAVEARLCAEDPARGFLPGAGRLHTFELPAFEDADSPDVRLRLDSGYEAGDVVPDAYDNLLAKAVAWAPGREEAFDALAGALRSAMVWPVPFNAGFLADLLDDDEVRAGRATTSSVEDDIEHLTGGFSEREPAARLAGLSAWMDFGEPRGAGPWDKRDGFRLNAPKRAALAAAAADEPAVVWLEAGPDGQQGDGGVGAVPVRSTVERTPDGRAIVLGEVGDEFVLACATPLGDPVDEHGVVVFRDGYAYPLRPARASGDLDAAAGDDVRAPLPGRIVRINVAAGDAVTRGQPLAVIEAMKMEHTLVAPRDGVVLAVEGEAGGQTQEGAAVIRLAPAD